MNVPVFRRPEWSEAFARDGYVLLPGLDATAVAALRAEYDRLCPPEVEHMYSNVHDLPAETNRHIADLLVEALSAPIAAVVEGYDVRGGTFLVKGRGHDSDCRLHQDWNTVDEGEHQALVAWIALEDVDEGNGCLVVAPGTHDRRAFATVRGANIDDPHFPLVGDLLERCRSVPLRAGEICLFAQNLFHGSWPNHSARDRVALYAGVLPVGVPMLHYLRGPDGAVRRLAIEDDFYYSGEAGRWARPEAEGAIHELPIEDAREPVELDELIGWLDRHVATDGEPGRAAAPPAGAPVAERPSSWRARWRGLARSSGSTR